MADRRDERLRRLALTIEAEGPRRLTDLAATLHCSAMTVRRDVASAPARFTTLGGHVVLASASPYRIERERDVNVEAKALIGAKAAAMLADGETIFIDCGATTPHLARRIPAGLRLTVVTYGLNVASALVDNPDVELVLLGGHYQSASASFAVDAPEEALARLGLTKAFLSAGGVHATRGASCSNFHEVAVKRAAMRVALESWLLADASKFGKVARAAFAPLDAFAGVIVAPKPPPGPEVAALGARLVVAGARAKPAKRR